MKRNRIKMSKVLIILVILVLTMTSCASNDGEVEKDPAPVDNNEVPNDINNEVVGEKSPYDLESLETRNLVMGHTGARGATNQVVSETLRDLVEEKSGGKLTIDIYGESQLGSDVGICADVQAGSVDLQVTSPAALITIEPQGAVFDMPFLFDDVESARAAVADPTFFNEIAAAYDKVGLHLFPFYDQMFRQISTNKNITSYEDLNGMTIRTMNNKNHIAFWSAVGVAPTPLDTADIFLSIQQGMLDGQENPYGQIVDKNLYDVQKYVTNSNHIFYIGNFYMSNITWDSLSETAKQIFTDAANEAIPILQEYTDEYELAMLDKLINEYNLTFIDFDEIDGLRDKLRTETFEVAYFSIIEDVDPDLVDSFIRAAGYEPPKK